MKQKIQRVALMLVISSATLILSCKKEKNDNPPKTKTELLTTGTWKYTACIVNPAYDYYGNGNPVTDIFAIMESCEKDDFEIFKTNGIWEYNNGPTKCDQLDPQIIYSEPWSFTANETKVIVGTVECTILELTETTLKLRYTFDDAGITYTEEDTYRH
jgi:hypothetical protein